MESAVANSTLSPLLPDRFVVAVRLLSSFLFVLLRPSITLVPLERLKKYHTRERFFFFIWGEYSSALISVHSRY